MKFRLLLVGHNSFFVILNLHTHRFYAIPIFVISLTGSLGLNLTCGLWGTPDELCVVHNIKVPEERERLEFDFNGKNGSKITAIELYSQDYKRGFGSIPTEVFTIFPNLKEFRIDSKITTLSPDDWQNATNLTRLRLLENIISELKANTFKGLNKLNELDLRYNRISVISRGAFAGLNNLTGLYLNNNYLSTIEEGAFDLPELLTLWLTRNHLTTLPDLLKLPKLKTLYLDSNKLTHIGQSLYSLQNLKTVLLGRNEIEDIDLIEFAKLPRLEELDLRSNRFSFQANQHANITVENTSLKTLVLAENNLMDPLDLHQLSVFKGLEYLILDENPYTHFNLNAKDIKAILPKLETLSLKWTKISEKNLQILTQQLNVENVILQKNDE